jgi:hypothetical protein
VFLEKTRMKSRAVTECDRGNTRVEVISLTMASIFASEMDLEAALIRRMELTFGISSTALSVAAVESTASYACRS